jgi:hypothetical protein
MVFASQAKSSKNKASLWLDQRHLFLGIPSSDGQFVVHAVDWNPNGLRLQTAEAAHRLTTTLTGLAKNHALHKRDVRLCLDDALCVTRVVTGDREAVERELEAIQSRSQLYLSLGLGEKLTGNLREITDGQTEYALTSIVNQRTIQTIYNAIAAARIKLEAIEPVTLSITRGVGLIGADQDQPVLFVSVEANRCDLAIARSGRLMLSYRISGVREPKAIADLVLSHMTRLRRFCQRVRSQEGNVLEHVYVFGDTDLAHPLSMMLDESPDRIRVAKLDVPRELETVAQSNVPEEVGLALWAACQWNEGRSDLLPAPDLLEQLLALQKKSVSERLIANFYPSAIAGCLILLVSIFFFRDRNELVTLQEQRVAVSERASDIELQLAQWDEKRLVVEGYQRLIKLNKNIRFDELVTTLAPCLPPNTRLETLTFNDDKTLSMRGTMIASDQTYEMLSTIKKIPMISQVSLESVNAVGESRDNQLQFDVRCNLGKPASSKNKSSSPVH